MLIDAARLQPFVAHIFAAAGCSSAESDKIAAHLVDSNLVGHDSHGVLRVFTYVKWLREGKVLANRTAQVVVDAGALAVVDGQFGFGQVIGEQAVEMGIARARQHGTAIIALRNCGHLGRIGDWPLQAAAAGLISLHFVNTSGLGNLVAPHGGIERRLSANPIAAGIPIDGQPPLLLDISTSSIAEGKIRVAFNKGVSVPGGCLIDSQGEPTDDPRVFYGQPPGAILPFGGHKGYGLCLVTELLAGALTGNGCTKPGVDRLSNGMLSIYIDPVRLRPDDAYATELRNYIVFLKSSRKTSPEAEILTPGEPEERIRAHRLSRGIELDAVTWGQILETAASVGVSPPAVE